MNNMTLYLTPNDIGMYTTTHGVTVEVEVAYNSWYRGNGTYWNQEEVSSPQVFGRLIRRQ